MYCYVLFLNATLYIRNLNYPKYMNTSQPFLESFFSLQLAPLILFVLIGVVIGIVVLVVVVFQFGARMRNFTYPVYDQVIKKAQLEAEHILKDSVEQARAIRTKAEMEAGKLLVDRKEENEHLRSEYVKQVEDIASDSKKLLHEQTQSTQRISQEIVGSLKKNMEEVDIVLKEQVAAVKKVLEQERESIKKEFLVLSSDVKGESKKLLEDVRNHISEVIEGEMKEAREAIVEYRTERLSLLDKQIVELVEETARVALNRSISFAEHEEIIRAALMEAKKDGIFER